MLRSLVVLSCLVLTQSQQCSQSCFSDTGGNTVLAGRCIQFYDQSNTFNCSQTSTWKEGYSKYNGIKDFFSKMFELKWEWMRSRIVAADEGSCLKEDFEDFIDIVSTKIVRNASSSTHFYDGELGYLRLTCPIGLFTGFLCMASVGNEACSNNGFSNHCGALPNICEEDVDALIRLCLDGEVLHGKVKDSLKKLMPVGSNSCSPPQFVYLGQPSNKVLNESMIVLSCVSKTSAELRCFKEGAVLTSAEWMLNGTSLKSTNGVGNISAEERNREYSCYDNEGLVVTQNVTMHCNDKEKIIEDADEGPTDGPANDDEFVHLWRNWVSTGDAVWPESPELSGLNALDNTDYYNGTLSAVRLSMNGRLTPVCGEDWSLRAGEVFCRELGVRAGHNWTAVFVGTTPASTGGRFYKPYLRDLQCAGNESNLIYCEHSGWGEKDCTHHAVVICNTVKPKDIIEGDLKIVQIVIACLVVVLIVLALIAFLVLKKWIKIQIQMRIKVNEAPHVHYNEGAVSTSVHIEVSSCDDPILPVEELEDSDYDQSSDINPLSSFNLASEPALPPIPEPVYTVKSVLKRTPNPVLVVDVTEGVIRNEYIGKGYSEEFDILQKLEHDNIIRTLLEPTTVNVAQFREGKRPRVFFLPYYTIGDLDQCLKREGHEMGRDDMESVVLGVGKALEYIHSLGLVHGDVTADNILLDRQGQGTLTPKLTDFGASFWSSHTPSKPWGTPLYMAPELLIGSGDLTSPMKSDIYSYGLLIWEVLSWMACVKSKTRQFRQYRYTSSDSGIGYTGGETGSTNISENITEEPELMVSEMNLPMATTTQCESIIDNNHKQDVGCRLMLHTALITQLQRNKNIFTEALQHDLQNVNVKNGKLKRPTKPVMKTYYDHFCDNLPTPETLHWDTKCFKWGPGVIEGCCKEVGTRCTAEEIVKTIEESRLYITRNAD